VVVSGRGESLAVCAWGRWLAPHRRPRLVGAKSSERAPTALRDEDEPRSRPRHTPGFVLRRRRGFLPRFAARGEGGSRFKSQICPW
jgi:hypothetical protein